MDKDLEQTLEVEDKQADSAVGPEAVSSRSSRRRFTRSAVVGGAVVLSLGNRAAWSNQVFCVSATTMASFAANATSSISPTTMAKVEQLQLAVEQEGMMQQDFPPTETEGAKTCAVPAPVVEPVDPAACFTPPGNGNGNANGLNPDGLPVCEDTTGG